MVQSQITGQWFQEHKPDKSMRVRQWLDDTNTGNAFKGKKNFNPDVLKLKEPTDDMKNKGADARREKARQKHEFNHGSNKQLWSVRLAYILIEVYVEVEVVVHVKQVQLLLVMKEFMEEDKVSSIKKKTTKKKLLRKSIYILTLCKCTH